MYALIRSIHPGVVFIYFFIAIIFSAFVTHPIFLAISLICSCSLYMFLNVKGEVKMSVFYFLSAAILIILFNLAFNRLGSTVLLRFFTVPVTLEALCYSAAIASMFLSVSLWFLCFNKVMTSERIIYVLHGFIPAVSMVLVIALRFAPRLAQQTKRLLDAQKALGRDPADGSLTKRIKHLLPIVGALLTWAFENAIDTADSMRARGYGYGGRTSYRTYGLGTRDKIILLAIIMLLITICYGFVSGELHFSYFPRLAPSDIGTAGTLSCFAYFALLFLPLIILIKEGLAWQK